jgi:hypothetical protein
MSIINAHPLLAAAGADGYQISRSVRLRSSASAYLNRTLTTPTNNKIWTYSVWVKKARPTSNYDSLFSVSDSKVFRFGNTGSDFILNFIDTNTGWFFTTTQVFRDPSAWMHLVLVIDTTDATAGNRTKVYVNGIQVTAFSVKTDPSQNAASSFNTTVAHYIGQAPASGHYFDGYMTEINFIDGQALTPSSFGETNAITGVWQPKKYGGTYGTNGFYLNFSDNSNNTAATIGKDYSGNGNNWTPNSISVSAGATYDSMLDVPTPYADGGNGRGNYCTLNPLDKTSTIALTNGNLDVSLPASVAGGCGSTFSVSSGKWYWEIVSTSGSALIIGIVPSSKSQIGTNDLFTVGYGYYQAGTKYVNGVGSAYGASWTTNVIGIALDLDTNTLTFYKDNVSQGAISIAADSYKFTSSNGASGASQAFTTNFGQRPFSYTPPTGFVALNTQNLPTPTISNGANYMAATTYTGTGSALTIANTIGSASFQPDLVWVKGRSGATDHAWYDAVRGVQKQLESNTTTAETTETTGLTAFGSTGFTIGALAQMNTNAATYVGWQWNAGGSTVTNTSGSISAQVRANTTAGFSVVTFTAPGGSAQTIGHGLGVAPRMIIIKSRNNVSGWNTYHASVGNTGALNLQTTGATSTSVDWWNNTSPTSTVWTIGANINISTWTFVAYCFAPVAGYSAFGSYTGNGSADGPFVYLGFRPRWVMWKRTDVADNWNLMDTARNAFNLTNSPLYPNLSNAEGSGNGIDILSNGFKVRDSGTPLNANGGTYIYAAFAEVPFRYANAR